MNESTATKDTELTKTPFLQEIKAQESLGQILIPLDDEARRRVIQWALNYFWPDRAAWR